MRRLRVWFRSFLQMLYQIKSDPMLFVSCFAPLLCGLLFKIGVPALERLLCDSFKMQQIIAPYYVLFDLSFCFMAPMLFSYASAMVILTEMDDKLANYYFVTPVGKRGYLIGRLVIPTILGTLVSLCLLPVFELSHPALAQSLIYCAASGILGGIVSFMIVALSSNKVEGMAVTKLSGILILGLFVPFFVKGWAGHLTAVLPSYWLGRYVLDHHVWQLVSLVLISGVWIVLLRKKFMDKLV